MNPINILIALTLSGGVSTSDGIGVIGVRVDHGFFYDKIGRVFHVDPSRINDTYALQVFTTLSGAIRSFIYEYR